MVIGDSIQAGTGLIHAEDQATVRLQRVANVVVHNFSSPGALMADKLVLPGLYFPGMNHATTAVDLLDGLFGMYGLVINLGTNDWGQGIPLDQFASTYGAFVRSVPTRVKVACMSPTWSTAEGALNVNGNTKDDFRNAIRGVCTSLGAAYLEGRDAVPNNPAYFSDGVHPNDRGHRAMGSFLNRQLRLIGWISGSSLLVPRSGSSCVVLSRVEGSHLACFHPSKSLPNKRNEVLGKSIDDFH